MSIATIISDDKNVAILNRLQTSYAAIQDVTDMTTNFLTFYYNKYKRLLFTVTDANTAAPIDITDATFKFTVKQAISDLDSEELFQETSSGNIAIVDGAAGQGQIDILPEDTASLLLVNRFNCSWDLQMLLDEGPELIAIGTCSMMIPVQRAS